jgi:hypothetical protein
VCFPKLDNLKEFVYKIKKDTIWRGNAIGFDAYLTTRSWIYNKSTQLNNI